MVRRVALRCLFSAPRPGVWRAFGGSEVACFFEFSFAVKNYLVFLLDVMKQTLFLVDLGAGAFLMLFQVAFAVLLVRRHL